MKPRITKNQDCSAFMSRAPWQVDIPDMSGWISSYYCLTWQGAMSAVRFYYHLSTQDDYAKAGR